MESKTKNSSSPSTKLGLGDDMVWEVVVRLPTKSLMRLRSVSRLWNSIIRNPSFAKEHSLRGGAFHGLLICDNLVHEDPFRGGPIDFFYANIYEKNIISNNNYRFMDRQLKTYLADDIVGTGVVKGLVGLYDVLQNRFTLCNIATHQLLHVPTTPYSPPPTHNPDTYYPHSETMPYLYHLGFDPIQEVYKLLQTCPFYDSSYFFAGNINSNLISFGRDNVRGGGWRVIDPPSVEICSRSLLIDGALYWASPTYVKGISFDLTVFDLNNETFQTFPIWLQGRYNTFDHQCPPALARIGESPAVWNLLRILGEPGGDIINVWVPKDNYSEATWVKQVIYVPEPCLGGGGIFYAGTLPTGEMVLAGNTKHEYPINIYCYDHINNKLAPLITISGVCPSLLDNWPRIHACYFEENIIPLDSLAPIL